MTISSVLMMLLTATAFAADGIAGHYVLRGVHEVGSELLLKPNGKFEFMLAYGAADYEASGTWKVDGDSVVLTTDGLDDPPFKLLHSAPSKEKGVRVVVKGPEGYPAADLDVALKTKAGSTTAATDGSGVAVFEPKGELEAVFFRIRVYDYQAGPYALNAAHNEFEFQINPAVITRVPFKGERLKIRGATLEMRHGNPDTPMNYEKQ